jgi:hypothetical protein
MRDLSYSKFKPQFWTGKTGKRIRDQGRDAQVIAAYLITGPHSNMIGLYYLPLAYITADTGIPIEGASKALQSLSEVGFCEYDDAAEVVWVYEMARHQVGETLKVTDKQSAGVNNTYRAVPDNAYLGSFFDKYAEQFHLKQKREQASPIEAPSKALLSPIEANSNSNSNCNSTNKKPSRDKREVDPRHAPFKELVARYWTAHNPELPLPWDGGEAKQLSCLLAANPTLDEAGVLSLLRSRHASDVNHSERPRQWLARLTDFAGGPLNQYGKPKGLENANGKGSSALRALRESLCEDQTGSDTACDFPGGKFRQGNAIPLLEAS